MIVDPPSWSAAAHTRNLASAGLRITYRIDVHGAHHVGTAGPLLLVTSCEGVLASMLLHGTAPRPLHVVANAAISIAVAKRVGSREGLAAAFGVRVLVNLGLVLLARLVLGGNALDLSATIFFVLLLSLLITYHDRFAPVAAVRAEHDRTEPEPARVAKAT